MRRKRFCINAVTLFYLLAAGDAFKSVKVDGEGTQRQRASHDRLAPHRSSREKDGSGLARSIPFLLLPFGSPPVKLPLPGLELICISHHTLCSAAEPHEAHPPIVQSTPRHHSVVWPATMHFAKSRWICFSTGTNPVLPHALPLLLLPQLLWILGLSRVKRT